MGVCLHPTSDNIVVDGIPFWTCRCRLWDASIRRRRYRKKRARSSGRTGHERNASIFFCRETTKLLPARQTGDGTVERVSRCVEGVVHNRVTNAEPLAPAACLSTLHTKRTPLLVEEYKIGRFVFLCLLLSQCEPRHRDPLYTLYSRRPMRPSRCYLHYVINAHLHGYLYYDADNRAPTTLVIRARMGEREPGTPRSSKPGPWRRRVYYTRMRTHKM